jgi:hypothetical protein
MLPLQKEQAETLRLQMIFGLKTVADVVVWADSVVAADPVPDAELLELATCGRCTATKVWEMLNAVRGECDRIVVSRRILADLRKLLTADSSRGESIACSLHEVWMRGFLPESEFGWGPSFLEEYFALAKSGSYGTMESAIGELDSFLARNELRTDS